MNKQHPTTTRLTILSEIEKDVSEKIEIFKDLGEKVCNVYGQSEVAEQLCRLSKTYSMLSPVISIFSSPELIRVFSVMNDIQNIVDSMNESIKPALYNSSEGAFIMPVDSKKESGLAEIERKLDVLQESLDEVILNVKGGKETKPLMDAKSWTEVEIKFKDEFTIEIYICGNYSRTLEYDEIGLHLPGKNTKPNAQWNFLFHLSTVISLREEEATIDWMIKSLKKKRSAVNKTRSDLSRKLKTLFGLKDDPFYLYREHGYYKPKFKIKPIPIMRGNGNIYSHDARYDDNVGYGPDGDNQLW